MRYILGVLNSKLIYMWLFYRGKRKGEMLELYKKPLSDIPIVRTKADQQNKIVRIVDEIISTIKVNPQADIANLETEIDHLVYQLYGLTGEEIKIVEGQTRRCYSPGNSRIEGIPSEYPTLQR